MSIRGIFVESIIRHIAGCLLVALVFPYILLKCVIMVYVIIDYNGPMDLDQCFKF